MNNYLELAQKKAKSEMDMKELNDKEFRKTVFAYIKESRNLLLKNHPHLAPKKKDSNDDEGPSQPLTMPEMASLSKHACDDSQDQNDLLYIISSVFSYTSFQWLDAKNIKKPDTTMKKLIPLYTSYKARKDLLATEPAWTIRKKVQTIIKASMTRNKVQGSWTCYDDYTKQPIDDNSMDITEGALALNKSETVGNQGARMQAYLKIRQENHRKMQRIASLALAPNLGLGYDGMAIPEVLNDVNQLLNVSTILWTCQTQIADKQQSK